ncbi:MAG: polysaccharide deacetylase family protein [Candidatus Riflebacteria bacterium]|nr:polysaccharide deacetylase family protein [Candidatus Riflebacteria bacterium]
MFLIHPFSAIGQIDPRTETQTETILKALRLNPRDVAALNAYGIEQAKRGDPAAAIRTWRMAIDIDPRYVHLYNNIGSALRRLGFVREALTWYQASLQLQPTYWTWYNLGLLREDLKQIPEAIQSHEEALRMCPDFLQAAKHLSQLRNEESSHDYQSVSVAKPPTDRLRPADTPSTDRPRPAATPPTERPRPLAPISTDRPKPPAPPPAIDEPAIIKTVRLHTDVGGPVFLTFDGGADADGIPGIMAALRSHGVHSTFFLTGQWVKSFPDLARQILADGHEIANHSLSHPNMSGYNADKISAQLTATADIFKTVLGRDPAPFFRFPFGAQNRRVEDIVASLGYRPVYWDIDTLDWKEPSVSSIIEKVRRRLKPHAVILMHCGSRNGSRALPLVLDEVLGRGYTPMMLSAASQADQASLPAH